MYERVLEFESLTSVLSSLYLHQHLTPVQADIEEMVHIQICLAPPWGMLPVAFAALNSWSSYSCLCFDLVEVTCQVRMILLE